MLIHLLALVTGFVLVVWAADRFVVGAAATARNLGISTLVVGLTVVGFGTSAPEILVSALAAWRGNPGLGIGNAIGSNITNIALVLGATAVLVPLKVRSETLRREFPVLMAIMLLALMLLLDGEMDRLDGIVLLGVLVVVLFAVARLARGSERTDPILAEYEAEIPDHVPMGRAVFWLFVGLTVLLISAEMLVWGAVNIAEAFGVSDLVIGLTIVALGTSLPELAASCAAAFKNEHDIAIGNVLGSNIFNLLAVLGLPGLIQPGLLPDGVLGRDFPVMIGLTLIFFALAFGFGGPGRILRWQGALLLLMYLGYQVNLYFGILG